MQVVPSLVGSGTAVAAAAAGLVFGQPPDSDNTPSPGSVRRKLAPDFYDPPRVQHDSSRPGTSTAVPETSPLEEFPYSSFRHLNNAASGPHTSYPPITTRQRPLNIQVQASNGAGRRHSFIRQGDLASRPIAESSNRDSVSSRDSWYKRLSAIRPLSQHGGSPRSSMGPESPSLNFSQASGVPMLGAESPASQTVPNKLVKRTTSGQHGTPETPLVRRGSRSQMLTLRRPATSHQRSATLQQFQNQGGFSGPPLPDAKYSFDQPPALPRELLLASPQTDTATEREASGKWTSFFHAELRPGPTKLVGRGSTGSSAANSPNNLTLPRKRVSSQPGGASRAYLTKAHWITGAAIPTEAVEAPVNRPEPQRESSSQDASDPSSSTDSTPSRRARRSISMHFGSPGSWISKTGSLRRGSRRGTVDAKSGGGRNVSAPAGATQNLGQPVVKPTLEEIFTPPDLRQHLEPDLAKSAAHLQARKRNSSSPLPPLSRLSSFNVDVARLGLSSSSSTAAPRHQLHTPVNYMSNSQTFSGYPHSRGPSGERASTLASSDAEIRDGISGDDEDTDFRSDGMFDSFRTVASSSRMRAVETPLESMFDESPPSTASNSKTKRLSIQEILGRSWDGETKITEEDESLPTPIRAGHLAEPIDFRRQDQDDDDGFDQFDDASPGLSLANRDFGRLSLDDDDDDDWARDDENTLSNHLSPPSSANNSRRVSPTFRHVLVNMSRNGSPDLQRDGSGDRPRSNIFDWCEPPSHDRVEADGHSPRPKTVHGKQELDLRGGRSASRKGPSAAHHVRSQSVPVVPDPSDGSKPPPKFGTWGLGTKTASEDWDDDFDFDETAADMTGGGKDSGTSFSMVVPASIQATQPTVKAHSGQIRELSLLVNDLKRLCRHGRDLDMLHGALAAKWKEAENIIALASPDEDGAEELESVPPPTDLDLSRIDERFLADGFDGSVPDQVDDPFESPEPEMSRTSVVRERQVARRRSVFSPDDDIFGGNWPLTDEVVKPARPRTPEPPMNPNRNSAVIATVIEAMQQQRSTDPVRSTSPSKPWDSKLFFDTNSLQELVKRAGQLRDSLSDAVRRAELITQSPAGTPRRERHPRHNHDGSPAFTRVFTDPASSPPKRLPKSHSTNSVLSRTSVDSPRMQMMTVS
ncbi:hypothetical protein B0H63DRAFT_205431 [Podospora didyma]|uniref:Uncharacterized protein n=1 Tax=Podospora didyma TaxID=330526 RepID=A0AAE0NHA0_9PEZI|nr:hypothetical protein B0H63DRAFT_205431 [Podospora didyma]